MKKNYKWAWCLMGALAFTLAGCATHDHDQYQGGYNGTYEQGTGYSNEHYNNNWNNNWNNANQANPPGAPYEWQHPSPRPQMEP